MEFLSHLWLPILLGAVAAWFWSFLSWAILAIHKNDWRGLPDEVAFSTAVRGLNIPPGVYGFPYCEDHKKTRDPEFIARWKAGPAGLIHVWRPNVNMGANMACTFAVNLIVAFFVAYAGYAAMPHATHVKAFQVAGTMGILAYSFAFLPNMIWFQASTNAKVTAIFDGVVQGLAMGGVFALLWPA